MLKIKKKDMIHKVQSVSLFVSFLIVLMLWSFTANDLIIMVLPLTSSGVTLFFSIVSGTLLINAIIEWFN